MASDTYGYNNKVADVIRPKGQGKVKKTLEGFRSVDNVDILNSSINNRLNTRNVSSGSFMGLQQVRGQFQVVDSNGKAVMIMGYKPGAF